MNSFYGDDNDDSYEEVTKNKRKPEKLKTNPSGPFHFKMTYLGIFCNVTIQNIKKDEFKISIDSSKKLNKSLLKHLTNYLKAEGFEDEATKHNLFWYMVQ
jgi:hypothetical protein